MVKTLKKNRFHIIEQMTLAQQVTKFTQSKNKWTSEKLSEAIYLTYIGSDDYLNYAKNNPNPSENQKQAFVNRVITSIEASIKVRTDRQLHGDTCCQQYFALLLVGSIESRLWAHPDETIFVFTPKF